MAPTTRKTTYHQRKAPAPKQVHFPRERKLVHRKDTPPTLSKRQSTLTQIDYVSTPHSSRREPIVVSSDDEDDEYEEAPRPKKRRKTSAQSKPTQSKKTKAIARPSRSQSTLTQKWDWRAMREVADSEESEEDLMFVEEDDGPMGFADEEPLQQPVHGPSDHVLHASTPKHREEPVGTIEPPTSSPRSVQKQIGASSDAERESTRPTTAESEVRPRTPKRYAKTSIPESESTASKDGSSAFKHQGPQRSPLKEKIVNVGLVQHPTPLKSNVTFADQQPSITTNGETVPTQPPGLWNATLAYTPKKDRAPRTRKFDRVTSIQESEPDEEMYFDDDFATVSTSQFKSLLGKVGKLDENTITRLPPVNESGDGHVPMAEDGDQIDQPLMAVYPRRSAKGSWRHTGIVQGSSEVSQDISSSPQPEPVSLMQVLTANEDATEAPASDNLISAERKTPLDDDELPNVPSQPTGFGEGNNSDLDLSARASEKSLELGGEFQLDKGQEKEEEQGEEDDEIEGDLDLPVAKPQPQDEFTVCPPADGLQVENPNIVTIDDDQFEEAYDDDYMADEDEEEGEEYVPDPEYDDRYVQNTYDPVAAALDRDAARFGKTETQLNAEEFISTFGQSYEEEEDDPPGVEDNRAESDEEVEVIPSSQPRATDKRTPQPQEGKNEMHSAHLSQDLACTGDLDDSGYGSQHTVHAGDIEMIPSSQKEARKQMSPPSDPIDPVDDTGYESQQPQSLPPKPIMYPSQMSTVVDSESDISRPNSAHGFQAPQQPAWNETFASSSPIPGPGSIVLPKSQRNHTTETQNSTALLDFSLPPPPPFFSSQSMKARGSSQRGRRGSGFE